MSDNIVTLNQEVIHTELKDLVRNSVEETLNSLLDAENSIRPIVVGRKNWLFCDTQDGAVASTEIFSLIETAKANGIDPSKYLNYLLEKRPNADMSDDELEQLAPWSKPVQEQCGLGTE